MVRVWHVCLLMALSGCTHSTAMYNPELGNIEITRWAIGTDLNVHGFAWSRGADGSSSLEIEGTSSEQAKALEAAARGATEGAVKAAAKVIKP